MKYFKYILLFTVIAIAAGYYMYNKPVKKTASRNASVTVSATELYAEYENNEAEANKKYLDKVIAVDGTVLSVSKEEEKDVIMLDAGSAMGSIVCKMQDNIPAENKLQKGDKVSVKGICTGMLMDVILVRCVINK